MPKKTLNTADSPSSQRRVCESTAHSGGEGADVVPALSLSDSVCLWGAECIFQEPAQRTAGD